MDKKILIIGVIIAVFLAIFFYPKNCGNWGTATYSNERSNQIGPDLIYKECTCMGFKYTSHGGGGGKINCFGIPTSYSCYYLLSGTEEEPGSKRVDIECP